MALTYFVVACLVAGALGQSAFDANEKCAQIFHNEQNVTAELGSNKCTFTCKDQRGSKLACGKMEVPNGEQCANNKECLSGECVDTTPELQACKEALGKSLKAVQQGYCATQCLTRNDAFHKDVGHTVKSNEGKECTPTLAQLFWVYKCEDGECLGKHRLG